ncbi:unnamed protein product [Nezara viridula]|uniref:Uncharacterized protein n=1 Tax=Nezara viridula TaxID=85310 RepID=A0A9P0EGZ6_NEZVI|nr:unnamed protein product [Nezara viridula]
MGPNPDRELFLDSTGTEQPFFILTPARKDGSGSFLAGCSLEEKLKRWVLTQAIDSTRETSPGRHIERIDRSRALSRFNGYRTAILHTDACTKRWFRFILGRLQPGRETEAMGPNPGIVVVHRHLHDSIRHKYIWEALKECGVDKLYIDVITELCRNRKAFIAIDREEQPFFILTPARKDGSGSFLAGCSLEEKLKRWVLTQETSPGRHIERIDRSRDLSRFNGYRTAILHTDACTKRWFRFILGRLQPGRETEAMGPNPEQPFFILTPARKDGSGSFLAGCSLEEKLKRWVLTQAIDSTRETSPGRHIERIDRSRALSRFNGYRTAILHTDACTKRWFRFILGRLQPGRETEAMGPNPGTFQLEQSEDGS